MYTSNPNMPKVRMNAVKLVRSGWGIRKTARYMGCSPGTITKWCRKAEMLNQRILIPTESSRPHHSPKRIPEYVRDAIIKERLRHNRCGAVIQRVLQNSDIKVSASTVNRVLDHNQFLKKKSKWKRLHKNTPRPLPENPGDLVEIDTIHFLPYWYKNDKTKWYITTAIDVYSRWAYAEVQLRATAGTSLSFLRTMQQIAPFRMNCIQTDNGSEFGRYFSLNAGVRHRHIRVRKPNDNAHIEKFNRTLQDECVTKGLPNDIEELKLWIKDYLDYYNKERLHMGINFQTPSQKLAQVFPRS
jgi:transposase InsO family protein